MERFLRLKRLLGDEALEKLQNSRVTVFGLGAVGGYVVEALARSGVGTLRIIDFDVVAPSNINRQLYALDSTVGRPKVELAQERIFDINPSCKIEAFNEFAHTDTLDLLLDNQPDMVIDAIDSVNPKIALLTSCYKQNLPVLSSMGAALKTDPSFIKSSDIFDTTVCPLARCIRKGLKRNGVGRGITCIYSTEQVNYQFIDPDEDPDKEQESDSEYNRGRRRRVIGSLPTITGIFGLTLANMALFTLSGGERG